jgi:two-component system, NarL family, sensor histidine kinase DevS
MGQSSAACRRVPGDGRAPPDNTMPQYASTAVPPDVLRHMVDALPDGVALADDHGTITLANMRLDAMFGYQHDELLGHPVEFLIPSDLQDGHRSLRASYDRAPKSRPMGDEVALAGLRKDGTIFPAQISLSPVPTAAGQFTLAVIREVPETQRRQDRQHERSILHERDRIADDLRDKVIQRIFAAGLALESVAARVTQPEIRRQVRASVDNLDQAVRILRDTIFNLDRQLEGHSFHAGIVTLCGELSPAPEITFTGAVDGALHPADSTRLLAALRDGLALISRHATPVRISITADSDSHRTVIDAAPLSSANVVGGTGHRFLALRDQAVQARIRLDIDPGPYGTRFTWHVPALPAA